MNNSMFMQYKKEKLHALVAEYEAKNPGFEQGKKLVFNLLAVVVSFVIIDSLCNITYYGILDGMSADPEYFGQIILPIVASLILAGLVYTTGKKVFVCILLAIVAYWLYISAPIAALIPSNLGNPGVPFYPFLLLWSAFRAIANIVQIAALIFILINKKCKAFLGASAQMHKQLRNDLGKFIA